MIRDPRQIFLFLANERGIILYFQLVLTLVIATLGIVVNNQAVNESRLAQRQLSNAKSFWAAEAGVQQMIWEFNYNDCKGLHDQATTKSCTSCTNCKGVPRYLTGELNGTEFGVVVNKDDKTAAARGYYPSQEHPLVRRQIDFTFGGTTLFGYGVFSQGAVAVGDHAVVNSYDSRRGAYGDSNVGSSGNIGTDGNTAGIVTIANGVKVNGNVETGAGGTVAKGAESTITGKTSSDSHMLLPDVLVPAALSSSPFLGILSYGSNQSGTLKTGDYKYDHLDFGDNANLTIEGNVRLYLTSTERALSSKASGLITIKDDATLKIFTAGPIDLSGTGLNVDNQSEVPSNFVVYSSYSGANGVRLDSSSGVYGAVYAPQTDVVVGKDTELYGSVVGETVALENNAQVHYDQALGQTPGLGDSLVVSHWRER